jgi:L-lactate dehydrogenase (cytochrome)
MLYPVILKSAGRDATAVYSSVHSPYLLQHQLDSSKTVGKLDPNTIPSFWSAKSTIPSAVDDLGEAHPHARWRAKARI